MQRILVIGLSGAGKSYLAAKLGEKLNLPVTHLDNIYWLPGFVARPHDDVLQDFKAIAERVCWVVDGNYYKLCECFRESADCIVFLDFNRWFCLFQIMLRYISHKLRIKRRVDLAEGFDDKVSLEFLFWVFNWGKHSRPRWINGLQHLTDKVVMLHNRKETEQWLKTL